MYLADGAHVPYGARPLEEVRALTLDAAGWLITRGCSMVVVACNTASAAALDDLRAAFPRMPFVGMEPAVKPAVLHTQTGVVGVLATAGTFKSHRYAELIARWAKGVRVIERPCSGWVELVEGLRDPITNDESRIANHVEPLLAENADVLVLGCTHFPFLSAQIEQVIAQWRAMHERAPAVRLIDPAPAVAQQTLRVWRELINLTRPQDPSGLRHTFFTTGDAPHFSRLASALLGMDVNGKGVEAV
jgi:glutamate racemase